MVTHEQFPTFASKNASKYEPQFASGGIELSSSDSNEMSSGIGHGSLTGVKFDD